MKFFIIVFTFLSPGVLQVQGEKQVDNYVQCIREAAQINEDKNVPVNAACVPVGKEPML